MLAEAKCALVIDDQAEVASALKPMLEFDGFEVVTANGGRQGLEFFRPGKFALVSTDFDMPEMNGHQLASIIKSRDPSQRIVMVTAYANAGLQSIPQVDLIIGKPFSLEELRAAIRKVMSQP